MKKSEHTPTPWEQSISEPERVYESGGILVHANGSKYLPDAEKVANAAFIVRAVNSHDMLVNALQKLLDCAETEKGMDFYSAHKELARKALAAAKGDA